MAKKTEVAPLQAGELLETRIAKVRATVAKLTGIGYTPRGKRGKDSEGKMVPSLSIGEAWGGDNAQLSQAEARNLRILISENKPEDILAALDAFDALPKEMTEEEVKNQGREKPAESAA